MMATIPMQLANYVVAGRAPDWRHYALNMQCYTHFTSPIRRYADVMVHRILTATLEGSDATNNTYDANAVSKTADRCNMAKLAAKHAQERSEKVRGTSNHGGYTKTGERLGQHIACLCLFALSSTALACECHVTKCSVWGRSWCRPVLRPSLVLYCVLTPDTICPVGFVGDAQVSIPPVPLTSFSLYVSL